MTLGSKVAAGRSRKAAARRKEQGLTPRQVEYLRSVPLKWRKSVEKLFRTGAPPMQAIRLMCYSCVGWENPVDRVRQCDICICPLQRFRPVKVEEVVGED